MKIAVVLYGQPRDYMKGYKNIMRFIQAQEVDADFFYHAWTIGPHDRYEAAKWRPIPYADLEYKGDVASHLNELYRPVLHECEPSRTFAINPYMNTLAYRNTVTPAKIQNMGNVFSQMYSRNRARNLLLKAEANYDYVIMTRFDLDFSPDIRLTDLDPSKVYVSAAHCPRKILPDNFILAPKEIILKWFSEIPSILNDERLSEKIRGFGERLEINPEELLFAQYVFHYGDLDRIVYHPAIRPI
jgi:hypothetical protein